MVFKIQAPATVATLALIIVRATTKPAYHLREDSHSLFDSWVCLIAEVSFSFTFGRCLSDQDYSTMEPKQSSQVHTKSHFVSGISKLSIFVRLIAFKSKVDIWVRNILDQVFRGQPKASMTRVEWSCVSSNIGKGSSL